MKKSILLILVVAFSIISIIFVASANAAPVQWTENGHWYEAIYAPGTNWFASLDAAVNRGGYLASVQSAEENEFIFNLVNDLKFWAADAFNLYGPWLGGYLPPKSYDPEGYWRWVTGEDWGYTHWATDEPNNALIELGGEDYLAFIFTGAITTPSSYWNDVLAASLQNGYIIEWTSNPDAPVPLPGAVWLLGSGLLGLAGWRRFRRS